MRRRRHAVDGNHPGQRSVGIDVSADDVQKIDLAPGRQPASDLNAFLAAQAAVPVLVGDHAHADDELGADPLADGVQDREREAQTIVEAAAVVVAALIGGR